jgi:hypothetical protein
MQQNEAAAHQPAEAHEARGIDEVIQRLQHRFPDLQRDRIRAAVTDAHQSFDGRPIRDFVPVFVERMPRAILDGTSP